MRRIDGPDPRWARAGVALVLLGGFAASCSGDEESARAPSPPTDSTFVAPSADAARAELETLTWNEVTLGELLVRFDVNGDAVIDATDVKDLASCVDKGAEIDGLRCDVVPDGVIDQQDGYLLSLVVGEAIPRSEEAIQKAAKSLHDNAKGGFDPDLSGGFFDWNHDGVADRSDVERMATVLEGDRAALDLDGNGFVSLADAGALAVAQARAKFAGGPKPAVDLDGDGTSDPVDVALLAAIALYTSDTTFGLFDVDQDAKIDLHDFCIASESLEQSSLFSTLMPAAQASAAFAAEAPQLALCRADGRAIARNATRLDTPFVVKIVPRNLYLQPVSAIPAGYDPVDPSIADGRELFVVSTTPSSRRLAFVSLPWDVTLASGDDMSFGFSGSPLPTTAALVLPGAVVAVGAAQKAMQLGATDTTEVTVPLPYALPGADKAAAEELAKNLAEAKALYDSLLAGCPCTLDPAKRDALVRYLLQAGSGLSSTLSVAWANLRAAEIDATRAASLNVATSSEAAGQYSQLSDDYVTTEVTKTVMLLLEAGYDWGTGGPGKALKGALDNLAGELMSDHVLPSPETCADATVDNLATSFGASELSDVVKDIVKSRVATADLGAFSEEFVSKALKDIPKGKYDSLETVIKTLIKMVPVYYLEYRKLVAEDALNRSSDAAGRYHEAILRVAHLRYAVETLERARQTITDLRTSFLAKLQSDGCGVSISTSDPCGFDLDKAMDAALAQLEADDEAAEDALDQAYANAGGEGASSECLTGATRRRLSQATYDVMSAAASVRLHVRLNGSGAALAELEQRLHDASEIHRAVRAELTTACDLREETTLSVEQLDAVRDAQDARQQAYADFEQAVKDALAAYDACVQSQGQSASACAFNSVLAGVSPLASGAVCVGCLPSVTMSCCGDGKLQSGEECDPSSATELCTGSKTCDSQCQCQGSGTSLPPSVGVLGDYFGIPLATLEEGYVLFPLETILHSSASVPSKSVAGDHTTITGMFAGTFTLDASTIGTFSCGAGPGPGDFTVCPPGGAPLTPGPTIVIIQSLGGPMPFTDTGNVYQYGTVFDENGIPSDNYTPSPQYPNDFFGGTDLWFEAARTSSGVWSLKSTNAAGGTLTPATTSAHFFISDSAIGLLVPASEMSIALPPFRVTAFRHTGDYGMNPPYDWDGSVYPAVADGLAPFPPP